MNSHPRIAIIGGGPGGLTLARLLRRHGMAATVFERDEHACARAQGGSLDLHEDSGLLALERAGLMAPFLEVARYEDQETRFYDKHGALIFEDSDTTGRQRPEIDRSALRQLLLDALPDNAMRWHRPLRDLREGNDNRWYLVFDEGDEGDEGPFDLVVGADGTWSRVRPALSPYKPQHSGLCFIEFGIDDADNAHAALAKLVGRGKMGVEADGKGLIVQRNGHAHLRGYAILRVPLGWAEQRFDFTSPAAVRAGLTAEYAGYADTLLDLFRASNDRFAVLPIHALPVGHCWTHRKGLTLIGDAAHVMSPFGGEGVNHAMLDALELSQSLVSLPDPDKAVAQYESQMFARVAPSAENAAIAAATALSHDGEAQTAQMHRASKH